MFCGFLDFDESLRTVAGSVTMGVYRSHSAPLPSLLRGPMFVLTRKHAPGSAPSMTAKRVETPLDGLSLSGCSWGRSCRWARQVECRFLGRQEAHGTSDFAPSALFGVRCPNVTKTTMGAQVGEWYRFVTKYCWTHQARSKPCGSGTRAGYCSCNPCTPTVPGGRAASGRCPETVLEGAASGRGGPPTVGPGAMPCRAEAMPR